jgi:hypothetical protein
MIVLGIYLIVRALQGGTHTDETLKPNPTA